MSNIQNVESIFIDAYYVEDLHAFDGITTLGYLTIDFQLYIEQLPPPSFYDVFPNLTVVSVYLNIGYMDDSVCDTLTGFNALTSVGTLNIGSTGGFYTTSFDGLHNLQSIDSALFVGEWFSESVSGFESLQSVPDFTAWTWGCTGDSPDFESLTSMNSLSMYWIVSESLPDFPLLTNMNGDLFFQGVCSSVGFVSLETVGGSLTFGVDTEDWENTSPVAHLDSLRFVGADLTINYSGLENLLFLSNLESVGGTIHLTDNPDLSQCDITYFCENIPLSPAAFDIHDNGPGCNSGEEVLATCGESYAEGEVFYDLDCDGIFNNTDLYVTNPVIFNELKQPVSSSNYDGHYFVPLQDNATTTLTVGGVPGFDTSEQTIVTTGTVEIFNEIQFALCPQANFHNVSVAQTTPASFRPGFGRYYYYTAFNHGPQVEDVTLTLTMTNMMGVTASAISDGGVLVGNTITWNISDIPVFGNIGVSLYFYLEPSVALGTVLTSNITVDIVPSGTADNYPADNSLAMSCVVIGSFDPNDIPVNIPAYNHDLLSPDEALSLDYSIRFQNTGTAEAINVRVLDDIESDLDISSFEMIGSSHPCTLSFNENNQVEWLFENILLPDSSFNEEESHGYIQCRIKTQPNLMLEDVVENTAAIYFDFNEPVITNTATTVFYMCPTTPDPLADQTICEGEVVALSGPLGWQDYSWTTFEGESSTTNQLQMMNLSVGFYEILFDATTEYCQFHDDILISVLSVPSSPIITQDGNTLSATGTGTFVWTLNGDIISDSDNSIVMSESGLYGVTVSENGCSTTEVTGDFIAIGIANQEKESSFILSPNPMKEFAQLKVNHFGEKKMQLTITNAMGEIVSQLNVTSENMRIPRNGMAPGVYFLTLTAQDHLHTQSLKLLVE